MNVNEATPRERTTAVEPPRPGASLVVYGPAQLIVGGRRVKLRNRGLALLYVLALQGPTRRESLADLLWDHAGAANNLRVELYRLRKALGAVGVPAFPAGEDPLVLPAAIEVDRSPNEDGREPLQGLDDLSPSFQEWLEHQRNRLDREPQSPPAPVRQELVEELAREMRFPFVLVLEGSPGAGRHGFVASLAQRLGLPLIQGAGGTGRAVHYIESHVVDPPRTAAHILDQRDGLWALTQSSFGRESELLLRLRNRWPPDRLRYLSFGPIAWHEAYRHLFAKLPFQEAARMYVEAGGHLGYMNELLKLRPAGGFGAELPLPQRIRASYLLEAHQLPEGARRVLDQLSVHPGRLASIVLDELGFEPDLDTLEMMRWLRFDGTWFFSEEAARRVIYKALDPGRRLRYHARLAAALDAVAPDEGLAASYHRAKAGYGIELEPLLSTCPPWARALLGQRNTRWRPEPPASTPVRPARELALLLERQRGLGSFGDESWSYWVRYPQDDQASFAEYALPEEPCTLHLEARIHAESALDVGLRGHAFPLALEFGGGPNPARRVVFAPVARADGLGDGTLLLPDHLARRSTFTCDHRMVRVECRPEAGVVEYRLRAHRLGKNGGEEVDAYDLTRERTWGEGVDA